MRPSPFNKNSGKPAEAKAAAAARPPSKLGKAPAAAPKPAAKGKSKVVDDSESEVGPNLRKMNAVRARTCVPFAVPFAVHGRPGACAGTWDPGCSFNVPALAASPAHPHPQPLSPTTHHHHHPTHNTHTLSPRLLQSEEEDDIVDMTISPAPARAAAPRRQAVAAAKPKYVGIAGRHRQSALALVESCALPCPACCASTQASPASQRSPPFPISRSPALPRAPSTICAGMWKQAAARRRTPAAAMTRHLITALATERHFALLQQLRQRISVENRGCAAATASPVAAV